MTHPLFERDGWFERLISGALQDAIRQHGPISPEGIGSAAKRVANSIRGALTDREQPGDEHAYCRARTQKLEAELTELREKRDKVLSQARYWRGQAQMVASLAGPTITAPQPTTVKIG